MQQVLCSVSTAATAEMRNINVMNRPRPHLVAVNSEIQNLDLDTISNLVDFPVSPAISDYGNESNSSPVSGLPRETERHCGLQSQQLQMSQSAGSMVMVSPTQCQLQPARPNQDKNDDDDLDTPIQNRKCIVCLRRSKLTEDVFEKPKKTDLQQIGIQVKSSVLKHVAILIGHFHIQLDDGNHGDTGICLWCLHSLKQWHIFRCSVQERRDSLQNSPAPFDDTPIDIKPLQAKVYKNCEMTTKAKEIQQLSKYKFLVERCITEADWDYFYDKICNSKEDNPSTMLEVTDYFMSSEKLTHLYCVHCEQLQPGGVQGFVEHLSSHTDESISKTSWPCDICGCCYSYEEYFDHWISHFIANNQSSPNTKHSNKNNDSTTQTGVLEMEVDVNCNGEEDSSSTEEAEKQIDLARKNIGKVPKRKKPIQNQRVICQVCGNSYANLSNLIVHHRNRHNEEKIKIFQCEACQKKFFHENNFKAHMTVHAEDKFLCVECGKRFKKQIYLNRHVERHANANQPRLYECSKCSGKFRQKGHLSAHLKIHAKYEKLGQAFPPRRSNHTKHLKTAQMAVPLDLTRTQDSRNSTPGGVETANKETIDQTFKPGTLQDSMSQLQPVVRNDNDNCNVTPSPSSSEANDLTGLEESCAVNNNNGISKKKPRRQQQRSKATRTRNALKDAASLDAPRTRLSGSTTPHESSSKQIPVPTTIYIHRTEPSDKNKQNDIEVIDLDSD